MGIVGHHHRAGAARVRHFSTNGLEYFTQCLTFIFHHPFWVIEINAGKFQGSIINIRTGKGLNIFTVALFNLQITLKVHFQNNSGNF